MTTRRKVKIGIALIALALFGYGAMEISRGPRSSILAGFDRDMHSRFEKISVGESKQVVLNLLGEPRATSDKFNLPQKHGFEHLFDAAERSPAVEYYQWINGGNWYYCIGFDSTGVVVIKGEGHS